MLIDWEYAHVGDAADEIAYTFNSNDRSEQQRQIFWRGYRDGRGRHPHADVAQRVRWWEPVTVLGSAFFWVELWAQRADQLSR